MPNQDVSAIALLEPLDSVLVARTASAITIQDFLAKHTRAKISTVFGEFKNRFFQKREGPLPETKYRKYKLLRISADGPIIAELGGESKVEGSVTAALTLLSRQGNGEAGFLQTSGFANIFYSRDQKGILCAIRIGWCHDGWVIDAISVKDPLAWNGQHEIFCPADN